MIHRVRPVLGAYLRPARLLPAPWRAKGDTGLFGDRPLPARNGV